MGEKSASPEGGCYKLTPKMAAIVGYDQPITKHTTNNPYPNISFGLEVVTTLMLSSFLRVITMALFLRALTCLIKMTLLKGKFLLVSI